MTQREWTPAVEEMTDGSKMTLMGRCVLNWWNENENCTILLSEVIVGLIKGWNARKKRSIELQINEYLLSEQPKFPIFGFENSEKFF